jgi:hypothetical protein
MVILVYGSKLRGIIGKTIAYHRNQQAGIKLLSTPIENPESV